MAAPARRELRDAAPRRRAARLHRLDRAAPALGEDVAANARAAAYRDPRFPPVSPDEIPAPAGRGLAAVAARAVAANPRRGLARLRPGVDGVYL
jgi:AMMECR1 domain-containing protein